MLPGDTWKAFGLVQAKSQVAFGGRFWRVKTALARWSKGVALLQPVLI